MESTLQKSAYIFLFLGCLITNRAVAVEVTHVKVFKNLSYDYDLLDFTELSETSAILPFRNIENNKLSIWNVDQLKLLGEFEGRLNDISEDGKRIIVWPGIQGTPSLIWNLETASSAIAPHYPIRLSPNGPYSNGFDHLKERSFLINADTGVELYSFETHSITGINFDSTKFMLRPKVGPATFAINKISNGEQICSIAGYYEFQTTDRSKMVVTKEGDRSISLYDSETCVKLVSNLQVETIYDRRSVSPDGSMMLSRNWKSGLCRPLCLIDTINGKVRFQFEGSDDYKFSRDGSRVLTLLDGDIEDLPWDINRIYDSTSGKLLQELKSGHFKGAFNPDLTMWADEFHDSVLLNDLIDDTSVELTGFDPRFILNGDFILTTEGKDVHLWKIKRSTSNK